MATPYFEVLVDWDNDGNFDGTHDNITDNIRSASFTQTRQESTDYMNGSILNVTINNIDNKYTPPNASGALYGKLNAGKPLIARVWYPYDIFTDSTSTTLASHSIPYDSGFSWTTIAGALTCNPSSYSQQLGGANSTSVIDVGESDLEIAGKILPSTAGTSGAYQMGFIGRYVDANNFLQITVNRATNVIDVSANIAGTFGSIGTISYTWGSGTSKILACKFHGKSVMIFIDDVYLGSIDVTSAGDAIHAGTKFGIFINASATDAKVYSFGGLRPLFKGKIKDLTPRPSKGMQYCYINAMDMFEDFKLALTSKAIGSLGATSATILTSLLATSGQTVAKIESGTYRTLMSSSFGYRSIPTLNILDCLFLLQDAEDGLIYMDGHGAIHFENNTHRSSDPHTTTVSTYRDAYNDTDAGYTGFSYDDGMDGVYNVVEMGWEVYDSSSSYGGTFNNSTESATNKFAWKQEVGVQGSTASTPISAGQSLEFVGKSYLNSDDEFSISQQPAGGAGSYNLAQVSATDTIQIWSNADGSGTHLPLTVANGSQANIRYGGLYGQIKVTNDSSTTDGYITRLYSAQLAVGKNVRRGAGLAEDSTSIAKHGERRLSRTDFNYFDNSLMATASAASRLDRVKEPLTRIRLDLINHDKATTMNMVHRQISDLVRVVETGWGMDYYMYVNGFQFKFYSGNTVLEQTLNLTRAGAPLAGFVWDTGLWDNNSWR